MTATSNPNPPTHALLCWLDDVNVYVQLRGVTPQHPYIAKFPLSEAGLSKALNLLRQRYEELPSHEKNYTGVGKVPSGYICESVTGKVYRRQKEVVQSDDQRAQALAVLRRMGIV